MKETIERLRQEAVLIFQAGVKAADPHAAVRRTLDPSDGLEARGAERVHIVGVGKAASAMAEAAISSLPRKIAPRSAMVVVNRENVRDVEGVHVFPSGHPIPDEAGVRASAEVTRVLADAGEDDTILLLISGGASALLPAPVPAITLADKIDTTGLLLTSGADIAEINTVRKHLSTLKGGGAMRLASPARVEALILSDVIGDDLSTIGSGLTAPDPTTYADARRILERRGIWDQIPDAARQHLERGGRGEVPESPKPGDPAFDRVHNVLVGSNRQSLDAEEEAARRRGWAVDIVSRALAGEAREAGTWLAGQLASRSRGRGNIAILAGGETTVTVRGSGRGGRNQELALGFALAARECDASRPWVFLSAGTDGRDGPTDAAGAVVDSGTLGRGAARSKDPVAHLRNNDSYHFLLASEDLLTTGATGTNVADLQVLLLAD